MKIEKKQFWYLVQGLDSFSILRTGWRYYYFINRNIFVHIFLWFFVFKILYLSVLWVFVEACITLSYCNYSSGLLARSLAYSKPCFVIALQQSDGSSTRQKVDGMLKTQPLEKSRGWAGWGKTNNNFFYVIKNELLPYETIRLTISMRVIFKRNYYLCSLYRMYGKTIIFTHNLPCFFYIFDKKQ